MQLIAVRVRKIDAFAGRTERERRVELAVLANVHLVVGSVALADPASLTGCSVSSGVVNAVNYVDITAPFSGTLQPFTWEAGDLVNAGDLLFSMRTTTIYATEDATVQAIYCAAGDDAAAVATRYGGLIAMRPESEWVIAGSITTIFHVNKYTVYHLEERKRKTGSVDLQTWRRGRKALLSSTEKTRIAECITKNPTINLEELCTQLGLRVSISTMSRVVRALGFRVKKVGLSVTERERPRCAGKTYQVERVKTGD